MFMLFLLFDPLPCQHINSRSTQTADRLPSGAYWFSCSFFNALLFWLSWYIVAISHCICYQLSHI